MSGTHHDNGKTYEDALNACMVGEDGAMDVSDAIAAGQKRYADALRELERFGPSMFTQTGGMCAALELTLERGILLVTDVEDSLSWSREELGGWGVGYYLTDDVSDGPEIFVDTSDPSVVALGLAVERCLKDVAATRAQGRRR